jgi:hypothetical protein
VPAGVMAAFVLLIGCSATNQPAVKGSGGGAITWSTLVAGSPTGSAVSSTTPLLSPSPTPLLTMPSPATGSYAYVYPPEQCTGRLYPGKMDKITAVSGVGAATVSWISSNEAIVVSYKVAAVSQDLMLGTQPPLNWITVAAPGTCTSTSTTVSGLSSGGRYVFWLVAVTSYGREIMIGRSGGILVQ